MLAERSIYWELMIEAAVFGCEHYDNVGERNWTEDCIDIIAK
jgi:hypothetical protein